MHIGNKYIILYIIEQINLKSSFDFLVDILDLCPGNFRMPKFNPVSIKLLDLTVIHFSFDFSEAIFVTRINILSNFVAISINLPQMDQSHPLVTIGMPGGY